MIGPLTLSQFLLGLIIVLIINFIIMSNFLLFIIYISSGHLDLS